MKGMSIKTHCFTRICGTPHAHTAQARAQVRHVAAGTMKGMGERRRGRYAVDFLVGALGIVDGRAVAKEQQMPSAHEAVSASIHH